MHFSKYLSFLTLACLAVLTFYSTPSMACSCMPAHPQTSYCNADYVVVVRVLRKSTRLVKHQAAYKVEIKKSYKMTPEGHKTLRHGRVLTPLEDSMCGVNLILGKLYVIAGRGAQLSLCNYVKEYQKMSIIERKGFSGVYRKACGCEVKTCFGNSCLVHTETDTGCKWSPMAKCETEFSACMPSTYRTPEGPIRQCRWRRTPLYDECMSNP
ncbi:tissue inhibitor of metalloproteinase [Lucilia sericata]|uniref:tissue inhibitor of metalloproteinase n=1 Tax=Lucilia sericata TaxID=13632 RepID=UPI0018A7EC06|nr:tissue inhibitor of metalloproteinase [Lucilia sericata]XP_037823388.1 tissue inhibitor of metalloproteinase [Lucilia sericata]XP_037823389.1 tissue inhibitor of metalloproteinase [Lucilia sericata]XP_037823390.1 tissue inhibitor of metalloproteinase [Lucilia sericata]